MTKSASKPDDGALNEEIARILGRRLPKKKPDPVLLNSTAEQQLDEKKLEQKARKVLSAEKKKAAAGKRLGIAGSNPEKEKALRKTATKGVVRLFNALRQAQHSQVQRTETKPSASGSSKESKPVPVDKFFDILDGSERKEPQGRRGRTEEFNEPVPEDLSLSDSE